MKVGAAGVEIVDPVDNDTAGRLPEGIRFDGAQHAEEFIVWKRRVVGRRGGVPVAGWEGLVEQITVSGDCLKGGINSDGAFTIAGTIYFNKRYVRENGGRVEVGRHCEG